MSETSEENRANGQADSSVGAAGDISVRYFGSTNVGLIREHNEDNFLVANLTTGRVGLPEGVEETKLGRDGLLMAVCDGMGGAAAGEVASQMAVDTLYQVMADGLEPRDRDDFARRVVNAVEECGSRIFSEAKMDRTRRGMGTTATVAGLVDQVLFCAEVGDSRAYVLRGGELAQVTKDQSLVNQLIEAGQLTLEEAENFEHSNIILQALGTTEEVVVDLTFVELRRGDRLMLCSDGLSGLVHEESIRQTLASVHDLPACCERLIELANHGGGHDNITVIVADFDGEGLAPATDGARPGYYQYPLPVADDETPPYGASQRDLELKSEPPRPGGDVMDRRPPPLEPPVAAPEPKAGSGAGMVAGIVMLLVALVVAGVWLSSNGEEPDGDESSGVRVLIPPRGAEPPVAADEVPPAEELPAGEPAFVGQPEIVDGDPIPDPDMAAALDDEPAVEEPLEDVEPAREDDSFADLESEEIQTPVGVALPPEEEERRVRPNPGTQAGRPVAGANRVGAGMRGMRDGSTMQGMGGSMADTAMGSSASMMTSTPSMALPDNPF